MAPTHPLSGIYAAAITPLTPAGTPDLAALPQFLSFLAERGCHGALLLGTTGEGPSFSYNERFEILHAAATARPHPEFRLLAGTGTPSVTETIALNKISFNLGYAAALVLPPYFFRNASEEGLFAWYSQVIEQSVPNGAYLLGYHIPGVSGVPLSLTLLQRLATAHGDKFAGLKDSTGDLQSAILYANGLPGKAVLVGNDKLLSAGMTAGASGAITALANLRSPELRAIYDGMLRGQDVAQQQSALDGHRAAMDAAPPAPTYLKAQLHSAHGFPLWPVRTPL
jgi:4-hydroxy-tetrahydrodipicolinate synthase